MRSTSQQQSTSQQPAAQQAASQQQATLEEAGAALLTFALDPRNWVSRGGHRALPAHLRVVNGVQICAAVDVSADLDSFVRVSFRGSDLSPMKAADLLELLVKDHFPFTPNTEWEVQIDGRRWIHFSRRYTAPSLHA